VTHERAARVPLSTELHLDEHPVARDRAQRFAEHQLGPAHAVEVAGVEQVDTRVDSGVDRGNALGVVSGSVDAAHSHQAEPDPGDLRATAAERGHLHGSSLVAGWGLSSWGFRGWSFSGCGS
jgi:hypothetical protein